MRPTSKTPNAFYSFSIQVLRCMREGCLRRRPEIYIYICLRASTKLSRFHTALPKVFEVGWHSVAGPLSVDICLMAVPACQHLACSCAIPVRLPRRPVPKQLDVGCSGSVWFAVCDLAKCLDGSKSLILAAADLCVQAISGTAVITGASNIPSATSKAMLQMPTTHLQLVKSLAAVAHGVLAKVSLLSSRVQALGDFTSRVGGISELAKLWPQDACGDVALRLQAYTCQWTEGR